MAQNSEPTDTDRSSPQAGILPANIDDPRFADHTRSDRHAEWTTASALAADLTEPVNETRTLLTSPEGVLALVESGVQAVLEALGSLLSTLLSHWGHSREPATGAVAPHRSPEQPNLQQPPALLSLLEQLR